MAAVSVKRSIVPESFFCFIPLSTRDNESYLKLNHIGLAIMVYELYTMLSK